MHYLVRRVLFYLFTLWAAVTINFVLPRMMPGNPVDTMLGRLQGQITPQAIKAMGVAFGIGTKQSFLQQYATYLGRLFHGNLGISITYYPTPVSQVIASSLRSPVVGVGWEVKVLG